MIKRVCFVVLLVLFPLITCGYAAQSTDDVTASPELKESVRQKILGDRAAQIAREDEYVIGHGDILNVTIFEEGDMAASSLSLSRNNASSEDALRPADGVQVMMDGRISLKHVGDVEVVGLTLTELANLLKEFYAVIYEEPIVTTTLVLSNSLRYTIMGNVQGPGIYFLDYPLSVVQTIARAGGFTEWANKTITVVREKLKGVDRKQFKGNTLEFDYDDFVSGKNIENNVFILSGDIIIVN